MRSAFSIILGSAMLWAIPSAFAAHYRVFVLTGQSNSLGTTNGSESDPGPGSDAADSRVRFFWHNVADASTSIGDSGGAFTTLQAQQGGHYPGSATHWGPEVDFARTLVRAGAGNVAIIKASRGGGGNTNWSKAANGHMYAHVVNTVTAATNALTSAGDTFEVSGLIYVQGESDTNAEADIAGTRFLELVDNLRADLPNAGSLKAVIGGIATAGAKSDTVRARHAAIADATAYIDYFPNLDLQTQVTDGLHFNKAAKLRIGRRFAQAFFANQTISRHYGKLVFIGDSITQGGNGDHPGYRYQVFKRLAEAGVPIGAATGYKFTGSVTGPQTTPALTTPDVNGQSFENVHEGHYGWRASWVNARVRLPANRRNNNRGEGTILNWTGQASPQQYDISGPDATVPYPDPAASGTGNTGATYLPDTVSIMIGINDLGDDNNSANQVVADIGTLIDQLRAANPNVRVFVNHLLHTNQTVAMRNAVDAVNGQLTALVAAKNSASATSAVWVIDANTGFDPVTMTYDAVHPNALGEEHVGDRIAAGLGVIEDPPPPASPPPPHLERDSPAFDSRFEGNEIWNGSALVNGWTQAGTLTRSLPQPTDLRIVHPSTDGRWIEGTGTGWNAINTGSWTCETRIKCDVNANGFVLWFGTGGRRIIVEVHGNRTQDLGGDSFNVSHNNLDGSHHVFRVVHDAGNSRYHVFRDAVRLTPLAGAAYDQTGTENRLIFGDYTGGVFGNNFDVTIDHVRYTAGAFLPPNLDTDGNGMPDAWEYQHFGVVSGTNPSGDPDDDGDGNLQEFQNGTNPLVADHQAVILPVFLIAGGGNARGNPGSGTLNPMAPGQHPAEQAGGVRFHNGSVWTTLGAAVDGSYGPEIAFARLLWDSGLRDFGLVKATGSGGNSLWHKGGANDSAYLSLVTSAANAAANPPAGIDRIGFRALLFIQGEENDAVEADAADTRFAALLDNLKADLPDASSLQGILGEIGGSGTTRDTTRARHAALAAGRADIGLARNTGTSVHNEDGLGIHYTGDSLFLLGSRLAAEALAMNLAGGRPLPAWDNLHAWYVADHAAVHGASGEVTRWAAMHRGDAVRDLGRRVAGQTFRRAVTTGTGQPRQVLVFDGTNDLWANASTEFGTISGARSVAMLCRLTGSGNGFLFDGSTNTGRTRAQARNGSWQAGVTPSGSSFAWDLAEPVTTPTSTGWQRHVFTYLPDAGNSSTTIEHWIDGALVATVSESQAAALGGLIVGTNGGSPFARLAVEVAEIAVYGKKLDATEVGALDAAWSAAWGTPSGPPLAVRVRQSASAIPRFGLHPVLEIEVDSPAAGLHSLTGLDLQLRQSAPGTALRWCLLPGPSFNPSATPLAEITGTPATWSPAVVFPLLEGGNKLYLAVEPARHATLGSILDAAAGNLTVSGAGGPLAPSDPDPAGALTLALVPLFNDVVRSGDLGITTFRIPGIVCDGEGVLHAVYDHRYNGGSDLPANIDVGYSRSIDGGATWSTSRVILDYDASVPNSSGNGVGDPAILWDPVTDTLWVAALWSFGNNGYNGSGAGTDPVDSGQYVLTKSTDGGLDWSAAINITTAVKDDPNWRLVFQGPGHGIALRDGTLVFPSQYRDASGVARSCSVYSGDHGLTWDFGSGVPTSSPQTNENTVCELDDGRLLFSMRTPSGSNGQRAWIRYQPGGPVPMRDGSWESLFRLAAVPDPVCQGSVIQWTSTHRGDPAGWTLFGNPANSSSRTSFTLRVSPDGGASWPVSRLLYPGSGAYSSICILPDKSIGVFFEKDNYTRITFARVEADWLMNPDADSDSDGLPDAWETLTGLNASVDDSQLDSDGDGSTNLAEWIAGTDPLDRTSRFATTGFTAGGNLGLSWQSVPGKTYAVEQSTDLATWSVVEGLESVTATSAASAVEIPGNSAAIRFLRVRVRP